MIARIEKYNSITCYINDEIISKGTLQNWNDVKRSSPILYKKSTCILLASMFLIQLSIQKNIAFWKQKVVKEKLS